MKKLSRRSKPGLGRTKSRPQPATKQDLEKWGNEIMSATSDAAKQKVINDRQDAAIEALTAEVEALKAKIEGATPAPAPDAPTPPPA